VEVAAYIFVTASCSGPH